MITSIRGRKVVPHYVVDTHALYWYLKDTKRLSAAADAVFRLAESGNAVLVVPAIVVAELYYLTMKIGRPLTPSQLLTDLSTASEFIVSEMGHAQLTGLERLPDIPELHDRLIAVEALLWNAALVTKDGALRDSVQVATIW